MSENYKLNEYDLLNRITMILIDAHMNKTKEVIMALEKLKNDIKKSI